MNAGDALGHCPPLPAGAWPFASATCHLRHAYDGRSPARAHDRASRRRVPRVHLGCNAFLGGGRSRCYSNVVTFTIELEREDDGRWIAEVPDLSGVLCYGRDRNEAVARVQALALRVIAERLEHNEAPPELLNVSFKAA